MQVGLTPRTDPHWPALVENLAALSRAGADAPTLLRGAAAEAPLPDEYQAAALLWRIARHTAPAVLTPDAGSAPADPLRPDWLPQASAQLGDHTAQRLLHDAGWAAVVTAVNRALEHGCPLADVLRHPIGPDGEPVPDHALADALIYRAVTLTDPTPADPDLPADDPDYQIPEPEHPDNAPPQDLHMLTLHVAGDTPLNLSETDYHQIGPDYDHWLRTGDAQPPLPAETIPTSQAALAAEDLDAELFHTSRHRHWMDPWQPTDAQQERALARAADAEFSPVDPRRIGQLNGQAAAFYQQTYRGSWAQTYLIDRLGTDLTGDPSVQPGYAPAGFTALAAHLGRHGATDDELLAAGLAKPASTGRLIDTFRDRLILPIHHHGQIIGFVGRRNPDTDRLEPGSDAAAKAGPKYLNTAETVLFAKGEQLYGVAEYAYRLAGGATPVLVEGPLDALAVTLASPGHVGVAPLGTSLTGTQADALIPHLDTAAADSRSASGVIVATDGDLAGQLAAERGYWMLTARGGDPSHLSFPAGQDPASISRTKGPIALRDRLTKPQSLAQSLVDERLDHLPAAVALPATLAVIAAGRAEEWTSRTRDVARRLHMPTEVALTELLRHVARWDRDRHAAEAAQVGTGHEVRDRLAALTTMKSAQRWAPLARQIDPNLIRAANWGSLADTIDLAHRHGDDVHTLLPALAAEPPLSPDRPASDLMYRLLAHTDLPVDASTRPQPNPGRPPSPSPRPQPPLPTPERPRPDTAPRL